MYKNINFHKNNYNYLNDIFQNYLLKIDNYFEI